MQNQTYTQTNTQLNQQKRRVGIFGGTFNPIHNGQLLAAEQIAQQFDLDFVFFLPNAVPLDATRSDAIEPSHRAAMVRLAIKGNNKFDILLNELRNGGESTSNKTILELKKEFPSDDFFFILGASRIKNLSSWAEIDELIRNVQFIGIDEPGVQRENDFDIQWASVTWLNVSSNDVRSRLRINRSVRYLIPDIVAAYIAEYGLYQGK